ncbi:hypothetical protein Lfu02_67020 [Longispora fulva]|uniref:Transcriptional regulator with XRE-family HTH domain n=1 Tax=Longispora fulva TaxID=619741 RepID=A0A8J7GJA2_9ACTN|nr:helix-turn-helix transcriptional regulator [Longispora fulva]MBG6138565.1 transcriptional regulator with XRE-family HTH domain [Longispora fulva]GIG62330.1 hypothetical protein Lfu02_67020 [Longispora fulva]
MTSSDDRLAQAVSLGEQLRALRKRVDLTGDALAAGQGWPQSKVSKIENGKQLPTEEDIRLWAAVCGADSEMTGQLLALAREAQHSYESWRVQMRSGQGAIQRRYNEMTRKAALIRDIETGCIPGMLQTAEYIRARMTENAWLHREDLSLTPEQVAETHRLDIEAGTAERLKRQHLLYEPGRRFEFLATEASLRFLLCPPQAMLGQLDRLLAIIDGMPNVTLGIVPFDVFLPYTPPEGFLLLDKVAIVETVAGETFYRGEDAGPYLRAWDLLAAEARFGAEAREIVLRSIRALRVAHPQ